MFYWTLITLLTAFYASLQTFYLRGWRQLPTWQVPPHYTPSVRISVLIPARNEAEKIGACVASVLEQRYPKSLLEILVLDDHSDDDTAQIVQTFENQGVRLVRLSDFSTETEVFSHKKKAIELGIRLATGELIVATDGDCEVQPMWLALLASFYEVKKLKFIAAPVNFFKESNDLERFQALDFAGMMGITGAGIHTGLMRMCNGANLAYEKAAFEAVGGFEGGLRHASGDDMVLIHKIAARFPDQVGFLKSADATVFTTAKPTFGSFLNQRVRWSTKSKGYEERQVTWLLAGVWLFCVSILTTFVGAVGFGGWWWVGWSVQIVVKGVVDYRLLRATSHFFRRSDLMRTFVKSSFYHLFYIVLVGFLGGVVQRYEWKGRVVR